MDKNSEEGKKYLDTKSRMYLIFAAVIAIALRYTWNSQDIVTKGIMLFVLSLLILGTIITSIASDRADKERKIDKSKKIFRCKHCGKEFNSKKLKDTHEKSCIEMKI